MVPLAAVFTAGFVAIGAHARASTGIGPTRAKVQSFVRRSVGPGRTVQDKFAGVIFGWAVDENGTDGFLTEVVPPSGDPYTSYVETFDQTTGKITKVVKKQNSGPSGAKELAATAIVANDVGLIEDQIDVNYQPNDKWYLMAPVTGGKVTGKWTPPPGAYFHLWDIADQQVDPNAVMATTINEHGISRPPTFQVIVGNFATSQILFTLNTPQGDGVNYPYLVAEDMGTHHAYVPAANYSSNTVFIDYDVVTGHVSNNFVAPAFSGPVSGIAIDSATHMMCTSTHSTYSIQIYNLKTKQQTFVGQVPNAGGEGQAPSSIAADPINHYFIVTQPNSLRGGSEIYVYDENGNEVEELPGFLFGDGAGIQVIPKTRTGWVPGPSFNQLQSFTY